MRCARWPKVWAKRNSVTWASAFAPAGTKKKKKLSLPRVQESKDVNERETK